MGKRAVVMSGGGARGAFELGALDFLINDRKLDFEVIAGVSVGALNAAVLAQGKGYFGLRDRLETLKQMWFGIEGNDDVYRERFLGKVLVFLSKDSIYDPEPIKEKIARYLDPAALEASGKQFRAGDVSLESGAYRSIDQRSGDVRDRVLASATMPVAFPPVPVAGEHAVDGGVRNITPLKEAFAGLEAAGGGRPEDPDEMYVLLASPLAVKSAAGTRWSNGRVIGLRALDILLNEIFREDLELAMAVNQSVRAYQASAQLLRDRGQLDAQAQQVLDAFPFKPPEYHRVVLHTVAPEREYMDTLEFDPGKIQAAYDAGREAAQKPLNEDELQAALQRGPPLTA